jgi:hypothetical protein
MSNAILGGIIGFLLGLIICYWKTLKAAYENRGLIGDISAIQGGATAVQDLYNKL